MNTPTTKQIKLGLVMGSSREGGEYKIVGDECSLRYVANTILRRLDGKEPLPWEGDPSTILCEDISQRHENAFLTFQMGRVARRVPVSSLIMQKALLILGIGVLAAPFLLRDVLIANNPGRVSLIQLSIVATFALAVVVLALAVRTWWARRFRCSECDAAVRRDNDACPNCKAQFM